MIFDEGMAKWIKQGNEVDLPRDPDNWDNLAYRAIRYNNNTEKYEYVTKGMGITKTDKVHYSYSKLTDMVRVTNNIHKIDDKVTAEENTYRCENCNVKFPSEDERFGMCKECNENNGFCYDCEKKDEEISELESFNAEILDLVTSFLGEPHYKNAKENTPGLWIRDMERLVAKAEKRKTE